MATYYITRCNRIYSICTFLFITLVCTPLLSQQSEHVHGASCTSPEILAHNEAIYQKIEILEKNAQFRDKFKSKYNFDYTSFIDVNSYFIEVFKREIVEITFGEKNTSNSRIENLLFERIEEYKRRDDLWFEIPAGHGVDKIYYGKHVFNPAIGKEDGNNSGNPKTADCLNAGFENNNWGGWTTLCATSMNAFNNWSNENVYTPPGTCTINGNTGQLGQHSLWTGGVDEVGGFPRVFDGGVSAMLGNGAQAGTANTGSSNTNTNNQVYQTAILRKTFVVDASNPIITYSYAAAMNVGNGHTFTEQPFFSVNVLIDGVPNTCAAYSAYAGDGQPGWSTGSNFGTGTGARWYRDWTTIAVPLHEHIGSTVELVFVVSDCFVSGGNHFAYAYVDVSCNNIDVERYCSGTSTVLRAPTDGIVAHQWVHSGETTPEVTITTPGTYQVWVLPYGSNCSALLTYEAELFPTPTADFSSNVPGVCVGGEISFTNTSTVEPGGTITGYRWNFGDGISTPLSNGTITGVPQTTGTYTNPNHVYNTAGTMPVTLYMETSDGCSHQIQSNVVVVDGPQATISGNNTVCTGDTEPEITFTGSVTPGPHTFTYNINGGASQTVTAASGQTTVTVPVPTSPPGTYVYNITHVSDPASPTCFNDVTGSATVVVNPIPNATIATDAVVCQGDPAPQITFTGSNGTSTYEFTYSINGGAQQTIVGSPTASVNVSTATAGTFEYVLYSVEDVATGCSQVLSGPGTVSEVVVNPMPNATITGTTVVCQQDAQPQITFTGTNSSGEYTFTYNINGGANQTITTSGTNVAVIDVPTTTAGTFTYRLVSVSDPATGCIRTINQTQVITVNPLPTATITGTVTVCQGDAAQVVTFTGSNGTSEYRFTYSLNGGPNQTITTSGSNTATITVPTTVADVYSYTLVSVEDVTTGCGQPQTGTATVTINPMPTVTITGGTIVCQQDAQPQITITGANSSSNYSITYNINGGAPQTVTTSGTIVLNVPTGSVGTFTYTVTHVSDPATGCNQYINQTQTVTVNPLPTATISGTVTVCQGDAAPTVTFTGNNSSSEYRFTYSLNGGPNQTITTSGSNTATITVPTGIAPDVFSYTLVSVEDVATGCGQPQTGTATVTINPMPDATITGTTVVCQQDAQPQITFTGTNSSGNYTFTYSLNGGANQTITTSGSSTATINVPTNTSGTFTYELIHVHDPATGCGQDINEIQVVTVNPLPTATIAGTVTVCQGDAAPTVTFTGSNALPGSEYEFTYSLNGGPNQTITTSGSNSVTITVPTTNAGTLSYTLISVEDVATGCGQPQTGTATVTINPMPDATITGTTVVCQQDAQPQITFTGTNSSGNYTFTYSLNGGANQTITTSGSSTATINVPTNTSGTFTYELIHVSDPATGCGQNVNESQTVIVNPLPTATMTGNTTICQYSAEPQITFTGNAGTSDYEFTYSINGGAHQTVTTSGTNTVTINIPTGTATVYTYTLHSVRDIVTNCFQSQTGTVTITINPTPNATTSGTVDVCQGSAAPSVTFTGNNSLGGYTFSYRINNGPIQTISAAAPNTSATVTQSTAVPGTYVYELINVMDPASLCHQDISLTETIIVRPLPTTIISNPVEACYFDSTLPEVTFTGVNGGNPYTFAYNINGGPTQYITSTGATATLQVPTNAVGTFVYTVTNIQEGSVLGCQQPQNASTAVIIHSLPVVSAGSDFSVCANVPIILTGAGASTYTWDHNVINGVPFTPVDTTTYTVTGTDHNGCQDTDQITVNVVPIPVMSIAGQNLAGCQPVTPILTNTSTGNLTNCTWYLGNGDTLQGCGTVSSIFPNPGCFDVTLVVTTPEGCTNTLTMNDYICVDEKPVADFYPNPDELTTYNWETQMINETTGASYYEWDFGDNSAISNAHSPYHAYPNDLPGVYNVRLIATSPNGCVDTAYAQVTLKEELIFYVPNTFTPDGDDFNETFKPVFTTGFDPYSYSLFIYNRWGEMVFESHDTDIGWNGRYGIGGNVCQDGTYTWKIEVKKRSVDERLQFMGHVNILR